MQKIFCLFFVLITILTGNCFSQSQQSVSVLYVQGSANVCKSGHLEPCSQIAQDMDLVAGDRVTTAPGAYVELAFDEDEKNVVRINSSSDVTLTLAQDEKINVAQGEVFCTIKNLPANSLFEIRTPTAVAGVRGTEWLTKVDEEGTDIEAFEGTPYAKTLDEAGQAIPKETIVLSGHMTRVKRFRPPSALMPISGKKQKEWRAMRAIVRQHREAALLRKPPKFKPPRPALREAPPKKRPHRRFLP